MDKTVRFSALGGGNKVGASCYYLRLGDAHIIFDCGIGFHNGVVYAPDYEFLYTDIGIEDFSQITHIFLSHGHLDHIGDLANLLSMCPNAKIYSTETTKILTEFQLWDLGNRNSSGFSPARQRINEIRIRDALDRIETVGFNHEMIDRRYRFSFCFYEAGHIPGASMIYIKSPLRNILYTGDFSVKKTEIVNGYALPDKIKADIMVLCGLNACNPYYHCFDSVYIKIRKIISQLKSGRNVCIHTPQLTKGIEILKMISCEINREGLKYPVAIDGRLYKLAEKLEMCGYNFIDDGVVLLDNLQRYQKMPSVKIVMEKYKIHEHIMNFDFSIHADYNELKNFIIRINPEMAYIVHIGERTSADSTLLCTELLHESTHTQIVYTQDKEVYRL